MIPLAMLEEIIDASGVAPRIEAMLPAGVRRRQLTVRALLAGMCLAQADRVCQIFCARGFPPSGTGCLSGVLCSRYLLP
jgi:hypothetical protein